MLLATLQRMGYPYHLLLMKPGMPHQVPAIVTVVDRCCGIHEITRALPRLL